MKLNSSQIAAALEDLNGWTQEGDVICKTFTFHDFAHAMIFVNAVAELAEAAGHHPDIFIRYDKVLLELYTHTQDGITKKDVALAKQIDALQA